MAVIRDGAALEHQVAAIAKRLDGRQAAYFTRPGGHGYAGGLRLHVAPRMDRRSHGRCRNRGLLAAYRRAADAPLACEEVPAGHAACQQVVHRDPDVRALLPVPTHSEHDNGPYITAGMVIARNPVTGVQNVSINRIQVHAGKRMAVLLLPRHLVCLRQRGGKAWTGPVGGHRHRRGPADLAGLAGHHAHRS